MLKSVLYVSEKTKPWPDDGPDILAITTVSRRRNADLDLTGALISSEHHFAQILEGPPQAVDAVLLSILRDSRHRAVTVIEDAHPPKRGFARWSLAYAGQASFVGLKITALLADSPPSPSQADSLIQLIQAFSRTV